MIRVSHSSLSSLNTCERKFQLDKLLVNDNEKDREDTAATTMGKAYGIGVASYLLNQDIDEAIFKTFLAFNEEVSDLKRTPWTCISLLLSSVPVLDNLLMDWEVAVFQDKPAIELSFRIDIDPMFYYVGFVDVVLRNRWTGRYAPLDAKSTALMLDDLDPMFRNSPQVLGYSIVLDRIAGEALTEYDLLYLVAKIFPTPFKFTVETKTYPKTLQDRLQWLLTLALDIQRIHSMQEHGIFPLRGDRCIQYMKPCRHFGTCTLHSLDRPKEDFIDEFEYQFHFVLDEVVVDYLEREA